MSLGNTHVSCAYDAAVMLMALLETVNLDRDCEIYKTLQSCLDALWDSLPSRIVIDFGAADSVGEVSGPAAAAGDRANTEG